MTRFDRDTAVESLGDGRFRGRMDEGWWIINGPNGGYVAAVVLRALLARLDDPARAPRSLTIHYLRPPAAGPMDIVTTVERSGRTLSSVSARFVQGDRLLGIALGAFGPARAGFAFHDLPPPLFPPPSECPRVLDEYPSSVEMQRRYDSRLAIGARFGSGGTEAKIGGWIRFAEPRVPDALAVAAFTDAYAPAVFTRAGPNDRLGPIPTIDLTIHFRATLPLDGATDGDYCAALFRSTVSRDGFMEEDSEIWSASGVLLAQSRQLALVGG